MSALNALLFDGDAQNGRLIILDQTALPSQENYITIDSLDSACEAIASLRIRGAPLLGVFSLFAFFIAVRESKAGVLAIDAVAQISDRIISTRLTAVNIANEIRGLLSRISPLLPCDRLQLSDCVLQYAMQRKNADEDACMRIAKAGYDLIADGGVYVTHCNSGALATCGIGTALGVFKYAHSRGKRFSLIVPETRPLLQGSRLSAFELSHEGIPYQIVPESALPTVYKSMNISCCITGADRIAQNGDTANKVGTLLHAILCERYGVPFYIAAPISTFDSNAKTGDDIPIEMRSCDELRFFYGKQIAPAESHCFNPAFDVTPAHLIAGFVTDKGILRPPFNI